MTPAPKVRPKYYDLNLLNLPPPGLVSIIHRISGALLFLAIPAFLYLFQASLASEVEYLRWRSLLALPLVKLVLIGFIWLYAHHFFAGIRYLLLDVDVGIDKQPARTSARVVLGLGLATAIVAGWCLW
jgi:succinate dehydrogenase / fumarate reductase cytochrome b subunit